MNRALFLFRRDLRLEDNTGLLFALSHAKEVILGFIFTPEQIEHNSYKSDRCLQFMIESLEDLEKQIQSKKGKLYLFLGPPEKVVEQCIENLKIDAVVVNADYTPYSLQRDKKIELTCQKKDVEFHSLDDALLQPMEETLKSDGKPYTVFTPFYRNAMRLDVALPQKNPHTHYYSQPISFAENSTLYEKILPKRQPQFKGGRSAAFAILQSIHQFENYALTRDFPALDGMTKLSAHLKFTTCSVREAYHEISTRLRSNSELIRSLYWRDFFTSIAFHFPHVFGNAFNLKLNHVVFENDSEKFRLWCEGKTGFPMVDAGMRQINQTGFMHNRLRMVTASVLIKDLRVDWRWGEKYFAQHLIDYDPAVNNGNWQWVASTGCDAQPYFRIFNPWNQSIKFDPDCVFIKQWIPELASLPPQVIHNWYLEKNYAQCSSYPAPIVDHSIESKLTLAAYKGCNRDAFD